MTRSERRRQEREAKSKEAVYHVTREQLDLIKAEAIKKALTEENKKVYIATSDLLERESKSKEAVYHVTKQQLDLIMDDAIRKAREEEHDAVLSEVLVMLLTLPLEVLMDHYWTKSYEKRIPEFTQHVLDYYEQYENGEIKMEDLKKDLWEYAGIRLEVKEV